MSHAEIAKLFGCSAQNVSQAICKAGKGHFRPYNEERCVYAGLRRWLNENRMSISDLCRLCYGRQGGNESTYFRDRLNGKRIMHMRDIDFFRAITGMSYEELFKGGTDGGF